MPLWPKFLRIEQYRSVAAWFQWDYLRDLGVVGEMANGPQIDHRNRMNRCERAWPNAMKNGDST
jgi:hypothetical protein